MDETVATQRRPADTAPTDAGWAGIEEMEVLAAQWFGADEDRRRYEVLFPMSDDTTFIFAWEDEGGQHLETLGYEHERGGWCRESVPFDAPPTKTSHEFTVTVSGCTAEQASQVMSKRLSIDEDYGFEYSLGWA